MHILLIEDDLDLGRSLQAALLTEGITSEWIRRIIDAPHAPDTDTWDAVLLDISLPDGNGLDVLERWRRRHHTIPILILSARGSLHDRLLGLNHGADDYLVKPFDPLELVARLRTVLRRTARQTRAVWDYGDLQIDPARLQVKRNGQALSLTPREFHIMTILAADPDRVFAKDTLAWKVNPLAEAIDFATLEVHISNLRRKIGSQRIRTIRGVGYQWAADVSDS